MQPFYLLMVLRKQKSSYHPRHNSQTEQTVVYFHYTLLQHSVFNLINHLWSLTDAVRAHLWKKPLMKAIWTCLLMRNYQEKTQQRFFTLPSTVITILANNKWQSVHLARIGSIRSASKFLIKCPNNWSQVWVEVQSPRAETKLGNKWINYTNNRDNFRICDQFVQIQVTHISWQILFIEVFSVKAQVAQAL